MSSFRPAIGVEGGLREDLARARKNFEGCMADNVRLRGLISNATRAEVGECPFCAGSRGPNNEHEGDDCPAFTVTGEVK